MVQFPETARVEWETVADAQKAERELRERIERGTKIETEVEKFLVRHEADLLFQQRLNADATPVLEMGTLADLANQAVMAPPADLIDGVLKDSGVCLVIGPAGSGKSTFAMQMIHSLMTGEDWLGQTAKPLSGGFGVISYDMDYRMLGATLQQYPNVDLARIHLVQAYKTGNPLGVPHMRKKIVDAWKRLNTEVVIIDSFAASFFGRDQNDAAQTMEHYRNLKQFALTEVGAKVVIVIVHSTAASPHAARGSTTHHDVADSIVGVSVKEDGITREVRMPKYRAAPGQHPMNPVLTTAPDPVTHLISLDLSAMSLAGLSIPATQNAQMFADTPAAHEAPDVSADLSADSDEEDDL